MAAFAQVLSRNCSYAARFGRLTKLFPPSLPAVGFLCRASCPAKTLEYFPLTLQDFQGLHHDRKWDVCQATFSLQSLRPKERSQALHWLASRCDHFLLVEFDVPAIVCDRTSTVRARAPERVAALLEAYARGAAEYLPAAQQPGGSNGKLRRKECKRVVEGFLVPMLLSSLTTGKIDAMHSSAK